MAHRPAYSVFKELEHAPGDPHAFARFTIALCARHAPGKDSELPGYEADLRIALRDVLCRRWGFGGDDEISRLVEAFIAFARKFYRRD